VVKSISLGEQTLTELETGTLPVSLITLKISMSEKMPALWPYFPQLKHTTRNPTHLRVRTRPISTYYIMPP